MRTVSTLVNGFLGVCCSTELSANDRLLAMVSPGTLTAVHTPNTTGSSAGSIASQEGQVTPPGLRKAVKNVVTTGKGERKISQTSAPGSGGVTPLNANARASLFNNSADWSAVPAKSRPTLNALLHLFGDWLFAAAMVDVAPVSSVSKESPSRRTSTIVGLADDQITGMAPNNNQLTGGDSEPVDENNQLGRAEACGALCRVFCTHRTREHVLPVYLARFYHVMEAAFDINQTSCTVLCNTMLHGQQLLKSDLHGVYVLVPRILDAVQSVLQSPQPKLKGYDPVLIPIPDLRRAAIQLLMSIVALPLHFNDMPVQGFVLSTEESGVTFIDLKGRIGDLLLSAIISEVDAQNIQLLLGCLMFLIQDLATFEELCAEDSEPAVRRDSAASKGRNTLPDTATELVEQSVHLLCQRLLHAWKLDTHIALAALELLSVLPKLSCASASLGRQAVRWLCAYIERLCGAPKQQHSRDLHSLIVCAFSTVSMWLVERPAILAERDTLHDVMETVELGISGDKSQAKPSDSAKLKADKELTPASKRVMDSAELCLSIIMDHVGSYPPPCGPESITSLLSERELLHGWPGCNDVSVEGGDPDNGAQLKYYAVDNSLIVTLIEQPIGEKQEGEPWLTAVVRGPNGRHVWTLRQRHVPLSTRLTSREVLCEPPRPEPRDFMDGPDASVVGNFPIDLNQVPPISADASIPLLEELVAGDEEHDFWLGLAQSQQVQENVCSLRSAQRMEREAGNQCQQPELITEFQTGRLFLSQLGLLTLDSCRERAVSSAPPALVLLDSSHSDFFSALSALDETSARSVDTVAVCYVKAGQTNTQHILANVEHSSQVPEAFQLLLRSLGWPVDASKHCGWAGQRPVDRAAPPVPDSDQPADSGGALYDGRSRVLYWADVYSELAFVVPSLATFDLHSSRSQKNPPTATKPPVGSSNNLDTVGITSKGSGPSRQALSLDLAPGTASTSKRVKSSLSDLRNVQSMGGDVKVVIAWVEDYQDMETFPADDIAQLASPGNWSDESTGQKRSTVVTLFLHPLQTGLLRVHVQGTVLNRGGSVGPLLSGMVISPRTAASLLRQTVLNVYRRRRLYADGQAPQVRRKMAIQEIVHKYRLKLSEADFFTALFQKN